jgi:regulatory protein
MKQTSEPEMLHRMAAYCSTAERCIQDVQKKIQASGLSPEASDRIIAHLQEEKFIDEARFARSFVNDKLRFNGWGRVKIAYELSRKNISPATRRDVLENIDDTTYFNGLLSLLKDKKKNVRGQSEQEVYTKLLRFAIGRGFESRETNQCLRQLFKGNSYADDME